jgi:hypothetical protein
MLGVKTYTAAYIGGCRRKVDADIAAFQTLAQTAANTDALEALEAAFFNNLVLVLDGCFVHRLRTVEGKDGNPMNEVRVLCASILEHGGVMTADKTIKLIPSKSVLGYEFGDQIKLTQADFERLAAAFFDAIESRFGEAVPAGSRA